MEDCYGLMGLKGTWTDLNWLLFCFVVVVVVVLLLLFFVVCVCVCVCVFWGEGWVGGSGRVKLFHCIVRTGVYGILCV